KVSARLNDVLGASESALISALMTRVPVWIRDRETWEQAYPASAELFAGLARSMAVLPVTLGDRVFGAIEVLFEDETEFSSEERDCLMGIAGQAAEALDRARLYEEQRHIAHTLQESLLPRSLPDVSGAELAAVYVPAGRAASVGGDFYDAFETQAGIVLV